mgnify:CR=1 FL=1
MKALISFLMYLHQLPQNLLGFAPYLYYQGYEEMRQVGYNDVVVVKSPKMRGGISLGQYVIVSRDAKLETIYHELGHCKQSQILGWLYLPFLGLQSIAHAALHDCKAHGQDYEHFWTESWATKLGEKIRKFNNSK